MSKLNSQVPKPGGDKRYRAGRKVAQIDLLTFPGAALAKMCRRAHSQSRAARDSYDQGYVDAVAEQYLDRVNAEYLNEKGGKQ